MKKKVFLQPVKTLFSSFNKFKVVHIEIMDLTPKEHCKWTEKETPEERLEDAKAEEEEKELLKKTPMDI